MTISFKPTEEQPAKQPVFHDVKEDQFFIGEYGNLFQKSGDSWACEIADCNRVPRSSCVFYLPHQPVTRILPHTTRIDF